MSFRVLKRSFKQILNIFLRLFDYSKNFYQKTNTKILEALFLYCKAKYKKLLLKIKVETTI